MPKIFLSPTAKARLIREAALFRGENPDAPEAFSDDLKADIETLEKNDGQSIPPGAMPGPAVIGFERCKLAQVVQPDALVIDLSETIYAPVHGLLRPA
jgi:hypothetical protein